MNGLKQHTDCANYNQDCLIFLQNNLEKYYTHIILHIVALISSLMAIKRLIKEVIDMHCTICFCIREDFDSCI